MPRKAKVVTPSRSQFGNARKLPSGRFQARYTEKGIEYYPFPGRTFETRSAAYQALNDFESDRRRGRLVTSRQTLLLADWCKTWMPVHTAELKPGTKADYTNIINNGILRPGTRLATMDVAEITEMDVRAWSTEMGEHWVAARRAKGMRVLTMILTSAKRAGKCDTVATEGVVVRTGANSRGTGQPKQHFYLYLHEIARLVAAAEYVPQREHEDWGLFFNVMAWTGMRPQEVRALWPEQINRVGEFILVNAAISDGDKASGGLVRTTTKPGRERAAYAPAPVLDALLARIEQFGIRSDNLVFPQDDWRKIMWSSTYNDQGWVPMVGVSGVWADKTSFLAGRRKDPIPYDLRSAFVSHMRSAGVPDIDTGAQVGHVDSATSDLYTVVALAGMEDPIPVAARQATTLTRKSVIDYLFNEAQATL